MKIEITKTDHPGVSPGSWDDSTLKVYLKDDKHIIDRVADAIADALAPQPLNSRKE